MRDPFHEDIEALDKLDAKRKAALERFPIKRIGDIKIEAPHWLADRFIEEGTTGALIGESGAGKSFIAVDIALSIATGIPWHGHAVVQGPVLYIAGEGRGGILRRALGWARVNDKSMGLIDFYVTPGPIDLSNDEAMEDVRFALEAVFLQVGKPKLIIADTWATSLGADENSTADTVRGLSALRSLAEPYGAAVLIVHHVGHGDKSRARGSSALHAALDMVHLIE